MPKPSLENPFLDQVDRDSDKERFFAKVLKNNREPAIKKRSEDWVDADTELNADPKILEEEKIFSEIIALESQALRAFFGKEIPVPSIPQEITVERLKKWREQGFELHYLPEADLGRVNHQLNESETTLEFKDTPGWKKKLVYWGKNSTPPLPSNFLKLRAGWVLIETRQYSEAINAYENDVFGPAIKRLRMRGVVLNFSEETRKWFSYKDLKKPAVQLAFAEILGVDVEQIRLPEQMEVNVLGNIHAYWKNPGLLEWRDLTGSYDQNYSIAGSIGGFALMRTDTSDEGLGFRLMVRF
ncbi:MAG TPA: hypothetical protein VFQ60_02315 [Patescibacteria group bacterium]|nr:hypothetical protein [Patescibacteria group bacterium]